MVRPRIPTERGDFLRMRREESARIERAERIKNMQDARQPPAPPEVAAIISTIESDPDGENDPLTWRRFADEYAKDFDFGMAYRRTYPHHNMRGAAAKAAGERMAQHPIVAREIARARVGRITIEDITPNRVMLEYARIAFSDVRKIVNVDGIEDGAEASLIALSDLDEDTARAIKEIEISGKGVTIKLADKTRALGALADMLGLTAAVEGRKAGGIDGAISPALSLESADDAEIEAMLALGDGEIVDEKDAETDLEAWPFEDDEEL